MNSLLTDSFPRCNNPNLFVMQMIGDNKSSFPLRQSLNSCPDIPNKISLQQSIITGRQILIHNQF